MILHLPTAVPRCAHLLRLSNARPMSMGSGYGPFPYPKSLMTMLQPNGLCVSIVEVVRGADHRN